MQSVQLFDKQLIENFLSNDERLCIHSLECLETIDSTNCYLMSKKNKRSGMICLAEHQTSGKGRQGKSWFSPYGKNLYLSFGWETAPPLAAVTGVSLAVGVMVAQAIETLGVSDLQLKWPNDIWYAGRKLAGVLIEVVQGYIVIGIGLNICMSMLPQTAIDQPWTDLLSITGRVPDKNQVAALIIQELLNGLSHFEKSGFESFRGQWQERDVLLGNSILVKTPKEKITGMAAGVDAKGALLVDTLHGQVSIVSGDIYRDGNSIRDISN